MLATHCKAFSSRSSSLTDSEPDSDELLYLSFILSAIFLVHWNWRRSAELSNRAQNSLSNLFFQDLVSDVKCMPVVLVGVFFHTRINFVDCAGADPSMSKVKAKFSTSHFTSK